MLGAAPSGGLSTEPPAPMRAAVLTFSREMKGVLSYERDVDVNVRAGPFAHTEQNKAVLVARDGAVVSIHFESLSRHGKALGRRELADYERTVNDELRAGKGYFHRPYDARYLEEYVYAPVAVCPDCPAGGTSFVFSSDRHDAEHGLGTIVLDAAGHAVRILYTPYVLPDRVQTGEVSETAEEVLPGLFGVTHVRGKYFGRLGPVSGSGLFEERTYGYRRFATLEEAVDAIHR